MTTHEKNKEKQREYSKLYYRRIKRRKALENSAARVEREGVEREKILTKYFG